MYAKVENNVIVKANSSLASFNKAEPSWSAEQLAANGIYEVIYDNTNLKDSRFYINGAESFTFANDVVTASYAAAVGKTLDDVNAVVHLAAETGTGQSMYQLEEYQHTNISGTLNIINHLCLQS